MYQLVALTSKAKLYIPRPKYYKHCDYILWQLFSLPCPEKLNSHKKHENKTLKVEFAILNVSTS